MARNNCPCEESPLKWRDWIGLPHVIGSNPREGQAGCCLVIASVVLASGGVELPMGLDHWLGLARDARWDELRDGFEAFTSPLQGAQELALTLLDNGSHGLGLGVVVEPRWLLSCHHERGVIAIPTTVLRPRDFRQVQQ
jgi:hypothetical protein